ncbi:MAG: DUF1015 domain-containing protein [Deltaproteobacteria bacterium]|nr:MAG: DUF1015 domain-containing protein [Deltaproteobacteria bacterium]
MPRILPFRGLRYDLPRAGRAEDLLAPPYDVVDEAGRRAIAARSPNNCIRVILPEGEGAAKYARGAAEFRRLVDEALVRDTEPSIYVYHQTFDVDGRTYTRKGFVCLMELSPFGEGKVLPHERTLAGPRADRLELMRAADAHLELVFGLFPDPQRAWEQAVGDLGQPVLDAELDGVRHVLYRVADPAAISALAEVLEPKKVYIADGHHRYTTMVEYAKELRARGRPGADFGMIYLSNLDDPGLVVLPTHRLVHDVPSFDAEALVDRLRAHFDVEQVALPASVGQLRERLAEAGRQGTAFALSVPGSGTAWVLSTRADFDPAKTRLAALPEALRHLDVVLLHELVLEEGLGITKDAQERKLNIYYEKSSERALEEARVPGTHHTGVQLVCFMNATPVGDVVAVCDSGEVMPQKSTFFHPKIPTGLVFHDLSPES